MHLFIDNRPISLFLAFFSAEFKLVTHMCSCAYWHYNIYIILLYSSPSWNGTEHNWTFLHFDICNQQTIFYSKYRFVVQIKCVSAKTTQKRPSRKHFLVSIYAWKRILYFLQPLEEKDSLSSWPLHDHVVESFKGH